MEWLIGVGIISIVVYYLLKSYNSKARREHEEKIENDIDKWKTYLTRHYKASYNSILRGESFASTKAEIVEELINMELQRRELLLFDKHVTSAMAGGIYSHESKSKLYNSWYDMLYKEYFMLELLDKTTLDPMPYYEDLKECYEKFKSILEAFGYNIEEELSDLKREVSKDVRKSYARRR